MSSDATTNLSDHAAAAFVVLHHVGHGDAHYDLMIEHGGRLASWRCPAPPETADATGMPCARIGDHRRMYLDYEGPVSGGRGRVRRHDRGTCGVRFEDGRWDLEFRGERLNGTYRMERTAGADQGWSFTRRT